MEKQQIFTFENLKQKIVLIPNKLATESIALLMLTNHYLCSSLLRRHLLPCCIVSCLSRHRPAEEAAPCCHPQRKGRTLLFQWNSSHCVWCHRFPGSICGQ